MKINLLFKTILFLFLSLSQKLAVAQNYNIILGRPTNTSVTASVLFNQNAQFYLTYGTQSNIYTNSTSVFSTLANVPDEIDINNLVANQKYYYQLNYKLSGSPNYILSDEYSFHTQRDTGSSFSFTIEADEHLYDKKGVKSMYQITLNNEAADKPDFMLSLGDIFGDDHSYLDSTFSITDTDVDALHKDYRSFLGSICHSIPFYVCLGNHEGENDSYLRRTPPNNLAIWATKWRKFYYPNPTPNNFYSGSNDTLYNQFHGTGPTENYYAWTWGDALFVVLDVYRYENYTTTNISDKPKNWDWTIGLTQYNWLKNTLENSHSKYKFVFAHHILGQGRGGITNALKNEWGGYQNYTINGSTATGTNYTFANNRPFAAGWTKPIHQLFKDNGVNIFFQGHDHVFAHEVLDNVTYQSVPMAADSTYEIGKIANAGAYLSDTLDGTGHIRVTVSSSCVKVDYVKAYLPQDTTSGIHHNAEVGFSYTIGNCAFVPPVNCTSFNYSNWSNCNNNGIQTRTYTSIPIGCIGTPPIDSIQRTCAPPPPIDLILIRNEIIGQPTDNSILINAFFSDSVEVRAEYGTISGNYNNQTTWKSYGAGEPANILVEGLNADTKYFYRFNYRSPRSATTITRPEHFFHTQRSKGSSFSFIVQADPHLDEQSDSVLYKLCLQNQLDDNPDFMIDLGDFIMTDKLKLNVRDTISRDTITKRFNLLRSFYEYSSHSIPLFIALGNHEAESGWNLKNGANNMAIWNTLDRKKFFLNPTPSTFYSGDTTNTNYIGKRAGYYSWKWGDALFIVLDPYWNTNTKPDSLHGWRWTLGKTQYDWLKSILENSQEKFKFVFAHQIIGGDPDGRGGVEFANQYEWGGKSLNGIDSFSTYRPGWYKPIKELLAEHHVNIFFHGHDHFFGKQEKDCLVYQETPQPSHPNPSNTDNVPYASTYGYHEGVIQASSGHLRVTVNGNGVKVDYIRTYLPANEDATHHNKDISATYFIGSKNCYDSSGGNIDTTDNPTTISPILWNVNYINELVYPNPFSNQVNIEFYQPISQKLYINIYDAQGKIIRQLLKGNELPQGKYRITWDGKGDNGTYISNGNYFYSIRNEKSKIKSGKIILIK